MIDYEAHFADAIAMLKAEGRYRIFADLDRRRGPTRSRCADRQQESARLPYGAATTIWG